MVRGRDDSTLAIAGPRERGQGDGDDPSDRVQHEVGRGQDHVPVDAPEEKEHADEHARHDGQPEQPVELQVCP